MTQYRKSAPHNVYVEYGFVDTGVYNNGFRRLGTNANNDSNYTKTVSDGSAYMGAVQVRLCDDRTLQNDSCYSGKLLYGY